MLLPFYEVSVEFSKPVCDGEQKISLSTEYVICGGVLCEEKLSTCRSNDIVLYVF